MSENSLKSHNVLTLNTTSFPQCRLLEQCTESTPFNQNIHFWTFPPKRSICISVIQGPRDEISSSGDRMKEQAPANNNNNRMAGSELGLVWGEEESAFERENWIPCWSWGSRMKTTECFLDWMSLGGMSRCLSSF
ncbi:hypothetical protein CEXT_50151 [Caerostris extrusa]|uniref:Uncharacterized protein n=1 Tax=Caerostris extrusa TaxID=172846 RepID=A0AAV4TQE1_CAEEX|nr:hypothetical protein CEXT_50151 [Caerostris extrusa]